jgi:hypothetical protein
MQPLRQWSFARVLLVCAAWVVLTLLAAALWFYIQFRSEFDNGSGSGGIGAVSFGISVFVLLIPVGPPVVLFLVWLTARLAR